MCAESRRRTCTPRASSSATSACASAATFAGSAPLSFAVPATTQSRTALSASAVAASSERAWWAAWRRPWYRIAAAMGCSGSVPARPALGLECTSHHRRSDMGCQIRFQLLTRFTPVLLQTQAPVHTSMNDNI